MIRHLFIAALRNMAANRLLSAIAIMGLAIGFTGAILMALVIRNQLTYDDFIPGHERIYLGITEVTQSGTRPWIIDRTHRLFADLLKLNIPEIESATRLMLTDQVIGGDVVFKRGEVVAGEKLYWADPNVFDVLPLPVLHGDLATALRYPDGLVLPRAAARKYFGRDDVVGQIVQLNGHRMTVRAVIEDLPANDTELETGIFASNLAPFLGFTSYKPSAHPPGHFSTADRRSPTSAK
jgi:putative ABC transport system permease protein